MSKRAPVIAAVVTVLACVLVQTVSSRVSKGVGEAAYGREVERLANEGRWEEADLVCRKELQKHPFERRAHFLLSRCLLERLLPGLSLQHLVLAAVPRSTRTGPDFLPGPSQDEIEGQHALLEERFADAMAFDWAHWRKARLASIRRDWPTVVSELGMLPKRGGTSLNRALEMEITPFALGLEAADFAALPNVERLGGGLSALGVVVQASWESLGLLAPPAFPPLVLAVGGEFAGGGCLVCIGESVYRRMLGAEWLFLIVDLRSGLILEQETMAFTPLSAEMMAFETWLSSLRDDVVVVGCGSGEAVEVTPASARTALANQCGLSRVPVQGSSLAYGFVGCRGNGRMRIVEAIGAAPDVPAVLTIE